MERWNPWWRGEPDPTYLAWASLPVKWVPDEVDMLPLEPFALNFVHGPRQVGKTTMLKLLINKLLNRVEPRAILYLSCDEFSDYEELGEVLDDYLRARLAWGISHTYIFLDEVTFVKEWWRAIKARIDDGSLRGSVVTVTGSASMELLRQREYFPGRRGRGRDITMMPLGFHSYMKKIHGLELMTVHHLDEIDKVMAGNRIYGESLSKHFNAYLETGGFPLAIREMKEVGRVSEGAKKTLLDGFRSDWLRIGKSESAMKEVIAYLIRARAAPISWLSISKNTSLSSPHTARSYVEVLENLMIVTTLNFLESGGRVVYRKNKKIHFTDPFIYRTLAEYCQARVDEDALVEGVVASHLSRNYRIYYWRNSTEVDCLVDEEGEYYGFEVKWGVKEGRKPRWPRHVTLLTKDTIPLFLSSLPFA